MSELNTQHLRDWTARLIERLETEHGLQIVWTGQKALLEDDLSEFYWEVDGHAMERELVGWARGFVESEVRRLTSENVDD